MKELFQTVAAKAAGGWQHAGANFDFEVVALPGGSLIAVALWLYLVAAAMLKRNRQPSVTKQGTLDGRIDKCDARPTSSLSGLCRGQQGAHCT